MNFRRIRISGLFAMLGIGAASAATSFVPAGGDLSSQNTKDWNPAEVPASTSDVSIPNAGTYWASADVAFNSLKFSASGETVVDQHAKGYDAVTVTAKGTTWALDQSADSSVVRLKGGVWDFGGKNSRLGDDSRSSSHCGFYLDNGVVLKIGDWRGSVHWSSSTQMLDNASSLTASGAAFFIYDRENKKTSKDNRFIVKGGSVLTAASFTSYDWSSTFNNTVVSGNEVLVTGSGSKIVVSNSSNAFKIGNRTAGDFTVRLEEGGEISGGAYVTFGSSNNRLLVDGGSLKSKLLMANTNNLAEIKNVTGMTLALPSTLDPAGGGNYNALVVSNASVTTDSTYLFDNGNHNTMRVTGDASWTVGTEKFIEISRNRVTSNNTLRIDYGGVLTVGFLRHSGDNNEIVISNGTLCATKINSGYGITLGYKDDASSKPVLRLQGARPRVTKGDGKVCFVVKAGAELNFELPAEGYAEGAVISMGTFEVKAGAKISVDCRAFQNAMTEAGVAKKTFVLAEQSDGMTINASVLETANANIVADHPERCRIYQDDGKLKLDVKGRPRGLAIIFR